MFVSSLLPPVTHVSKWEAASWVLPLEAGCLGSNSGLATDLRCDLGQVTAAVCDALLPMGEIISVVRASTRPHIPLTPSYAGISVVHGPCTDLTH